MYLIGYEEVSVDLRLFNERRHDGFVVTYQIQRLEGSGEQNVCVFPYCVFCHSRYGNEDWCQ